MRVAPGHSIPLWFRLWDGNASRYVLAHVTDVNGTEQFGSPVSLTYSGNRGIYTGAGPSMGNDILIVDYETYLDSGYTQVDRAYLPDSDWVEPLSDSVPPQVIFLRLPIKASVTVPKIAGSVSPDVEARGRVVEDNLFGFVSVPKLTGRVSTPQIEDSL